MWFWLRQLRGRGGYGSVLSGVYGLEGYACLCKGDDVHISRMSCLVFGGNIVKCFG